MIFQTQKNLLSDILNTISPVIVKSSNPQDISQYLVIKTEGKNLTLLISNQEYIAQIVIDKRAVDQDLLKIETDGIYIAQADVILEIMTRSNVRDKISIDFEPAKTGDVIKTDDPNITIPTLGSLNWNFPQGEVWTTPCIDTKTIDVPTKPPFDQSGKNTLRCPAGDFRKYVGQVGMAAGDDKGDSRLRNLLLRTTKDTYELVTTTSIHLAWATATPKASSGIFSFTVPYRPFLIGSQIIETNYEGDVDIVHNPGGIETVVMTRDMLYGDKPIGTVYFRTSCANHQFANFEKLLKSLNFCNTMKIKAQLLKPLVGMLDIAKLPRTQVLIDTKKSMLFFAKKEEGRVKVKGLSVPAIMTPGEGDMELEISNHHLASAISNAEIDEIEWKLSGKKTLSSMRLSPNLMTYFAPFGDTVP